MATRLPAGLRIAAAGICTGLVLAPAYGQDNRYEHERAGIYIGAFITDRDTETRLDSDLGVGTDIDWENDLGLESSMTVLRVGGNYWFKPRQRLDFSVFDLSRSAQRRIDETIEFGDESFTVDTVVHSNFDLSITKVDYTFAPLSRPRGYLGFTAGLYIADVQVSLSEATFGTAESEEVTAPLPVLGLRGEYEISERFTLNGATQWFAIDTDDASGRLRDLFVGVDYRIGSRWDLGLGYNDVSMRVTSDAEDDFDGELNWGYDGWLMYFRAEFGGATAR